MTLAAKAEAALDALELGVSSHADRLRCDTIRRRLREVESADELRTEIAALKDQVGALLAQLAWERRGI